MPTATLGPNRFIALQYGLPKEGLVTLDLESDIPVKTYIIRPKALEFYRQGKKNFVYYGGYPDPRKHQHQRIYLPFSGPWYLIISNPDKNSGADVQYEVSY